MTSLPLKRTEYWNWSSPVPGPRGDQTDRAESFTDAEHYFLPLAQIGASALHTAGVAEGFAVTAVSGEQRLTVRPGVAVDQAGHVVALAGGGFAILDPTVDPDDPRNIPTVSLPEGDVGVIVPTDDLPGDVSAALPGDLVLTVTWREVLGDTPGVSERVHAPWLRLLVPNAPALGEQVVLARVSLDADGTVTALSPAGRVLAGIPAERLVLRRPTGPPGAPRVDQEPAGELRARPDGGLELNRLVGGATRPVLAVDAGGNVAVSPVGGDVTVSPVGGDVTVSPPGGGVTITPGGGVTIAPDGVVTIAPQGGISLAPQNGDVRVPPGTEVGVGLTGGPQRTLHVEGQEVHSGGPGGGFSFADRGKPFTESPTNGERWVWYAQAGAARLWSGKDRVTVSASGEGGGLDVGRRMRVRQGGDASAGIWFHQDGAGDRAFVGMASNDEVGFFGAGLGWGLRMNFASHITSIAGRLEVSGQSCAASFCNLSDARLKTDVEPVAAPLRRLTELKGVSYRWRPESGQQGRGIGVLAQDVQEQFPELVTPMGPDGRRLGVDYAGLTAVLLEAVKTLAKQNQSLNVRNQRLEGRLEKLEGRLEKLEGVLRWPGAADG